MMVSDGCSTNRRDGALRAVRMEKKIFFFSRERVKECNDVGSWKSVVRGT